MSEQPEPVEDGGDRPIATPMDRLREKRRQSLAAPRHLDLPIPGFDGELVARYRPLPWGRLVPLIEQSESDDPEESLTAHLHTLVEACAALMVPDANGELVSLADELRKDGQEGIHGEVTLGANNNYLSGALGVPHPDTARELVLSVFEGAISAEAMVTRHAITFGRWMGSVAEEVDAEVGEG